MQAYEESVKVLIVSENLDTCELYAPILLDRYSIVKSITFENEHFLKEFYDSDLIVIDISFYESLKYLSVVDIHRAFRPKIILVYPFASTFFRKKIESFSYLDLVVLKPLKAQKLLEYVYSFEDEIINHYILKEKNDVLVQFINNSPFRMAIYSIDGRAYFVNKEYTQALKKRKITHLEGKHFDQISTCDHKFDHIRTRLLLKREAFTVDKQEKDSQNWFRSSFYLLDEKYIVHKCEDITKDVQAQEKLKQSAIFFENANEGIVITDENARIISINNAFSKITGFAFDDVQGLTPAVLKSGIHNDQFYQNMWDSLQNNGSWQGEIWNRRKNGEIYPQWLSISKVANSNSITKSFYIAIFTDITNLKEADKKIYFYANHDHLTGLANRLNIESRFSHTLEMAKRHKTMAAIMFIDIDHFKDINDTYGHQVGDQVIKVIASRIKENIRDSDTLGRLGGDEFLLVISSFKQTEDVLFVTQKIQDAIKSPISINDELFYITVSIGIALYPEHGDNTEILKQNADMAMYKVKQNGRNGYEIFSSELSQNLIKKVTMLTEIRDAIANDEFEVYFQPFVNVKSQEFVGAEALIRWNHPQKGMVSPIEFIPLAEDNNLIGDISTIVFHKTLESLEKVNKTLKNNAFKMAVNINAREFFEKNFVEKISSFFEGYNVDFSQIEIEITETQIMQNYAVAQSIFEQLRQRGFGIAIDDFGTGHSSLSYLKYFKIDKLKIDKSFILDAPYDQDDKVIAKTIVGMAKTLELIVQAEGVEEEVHKDFVKKIDCDYAQGFFYSKPIQFDILLQLLQKRDK